jgi:DNA-binding MarR family transcriptional regulator
MAFVKAFDAWSRRASVAKAGESVPRLQLLYELHCNGPRKMADLAETLAVTPRAVTTLVDALEAEDLVRRSAHPTDRRITMVEITGGADTVEAQFSAFQSEVADLFSDLDDADAEALRRAFRVLRQRIVAPPDTTTGRGPNRPAPDQSREDAPRV